MAGALEDHDIKRLEIIGFRGCAKARWHPSRLVLWAALEHPDIYPFIIMLADTRGQASINAASVQHELRNNDLILRDYGHLKYKQIDDPRPEPTLESDEDWQAMNCVLDNGVRILSRSRGQKVRGLKHRQHRPIARRRRRRGGPRLGPHPGEPRQERPMVSRQRAAVDRRADGRAVLIGNWLHTDGLMARLKNTGIFKVLGVSAPARRRRAPRSSDARGRPKYPTQEAIDRKRDELGDIGFRREMLLQVVPEEGQDVLPEDIHYYDDPPFDDGNYLATALTSQSARRKAPTTRRS